MSGRSDRTQAKAEAVAREAARYLEVVDAFAALGVDPHACARAKAATARANELTMRAGRRLLR